MMIFMMVMTTVMTMVMMMVVGPTIEDILGIEVIDGIITTHTTTMDFIITKDLIGLIDGIDGIDGTGGIDLTFT